MHNYAYIDFLVHQPIVSVKFTWRNLAIFRLKVSLGSTSTAKSKHEPAGHGKS